ncbi:MAG TPA: 2-oxoacid:acceptor oxidoreductase family protein [Dissulfurispiraceae bacterium]|nr:2-oxoacid:acceptor oxidoreductase family protein [Dissulfurispiraceae bacterium]
MSTKSFVFTGSGGQGVITAAIVIGEAAALHEGLNAVQTQVYGPEARGGATRADLIVSSDPIRYPKVINPQVLICLTQEAYNKFSPIVRPGGLLIADASFVSTVRKADARQIVLPMFETVKKEIGKTVVFNICMVGCVLAFTGIVSKDSVVRALTSRMSPAHLEMNLKALDLGIELAKAHDNNPAHGHPKTTS